MNRKIKATLYILGLVTLNLTALGMSEADAQTPAKKMQFQEENTIHSAPLERVGGFQAKAPLRLKTRRKSVAYQIASSGSSSHTCVITDLRQVMCWGWNISGQLGDGSTTSRDKPVRVLDLNGNATQVVTGDYHTCALLTDQKVKCWGGDIIKTKQLKAVYVPGLEKVKQIAAGGEQTCALLESGRVQCWGVVNNIRVATPVEISGLGDVTSVAVGGSHACVVLRDKTVQCWGRNDYGQVGKGTIERNSGIVSVLDLSNVTQIALSVNHSCALLGDKTVKCWGSNESGQSGSNAYDRIAGNGSTRPVLVPELSGVNQVAVGYKSSCALLDDLSLKCWGAFNGVKSTKVQKVSGLTYVRSIAMGMAHACALETDSIPHCWGDDSSYQLGDGDGSRSSTTPTTVLFTDDGTPQ